MQPAEEETDLLSGIKNEEDFVAESNALRRSLATQVTRLQKQQYVKEITGFNFRPTWMFS